MVPKAVLEAKYAGGLQHFINDIPNGTYAENSNLASARFLKLDDINAFVELVAKKGLHFHRMEFYSDDFTVFTAVGPWWLSEWLSFNTILCLLKED
ncbi:hypothetical protein [Pseudopedobacter saltans]|uniref:hypothetical protein n=1 Tax=Pseudopedobacter saltans TaxID=151895 RepID=UPI001FDEEF75|nr:hypothetical protein [Pseudopedobacter saltans]